MKPFNVCAMPVDDKYFTIRMDSVDGNFIRLLETEYFVVISSCGSFIEIDVYPKSHTL